PKPRIRIAAMVKPGFFINARTASRNAMIGELVHAKCQHRRPDFAGNWGCGCPYLGFFCSLEKSQNVGNLDEIGHRDLEFPPQLGWFRAVESLHQSHFRHGIALVERETPISRLPIGDQGVTDKNDKWKVSLPVCRYLKCVARSRRRILAALEIVLIDVPG